MSSHPALVGATNAAAGRPSGRAPSTFGSLDPHPLSTASFASVDGRPGTTIVAGALKLFALALAAGAIAGVALFRAELVKLVPFVGLTVALEPAIFAALVIR